MRLSASHAQVDFVRDGIDVAIRVGRVPWPSEVAAYPFLKDRVGPVCSPAVLARKKLKSPSDLKRHVLLHTETRAQAWPDWIRAKGVKGVDATSGLRFEHSYFALEAAASGLGIAIGSFPLVEADLKSGRLVAPFGFMENDRSYCLLAAKSVAGAGERG